MIRTGIYRLQQLQASSLKDLFGSEKNISLKIYDQLHELTDAGLRDKYSEMILNRFNSASNVIKRTYRNRFNAFDDATIGAIKARDFKSLAVHDMAISDGRASCYFLGKIISDFPGAAYQGSDIAVSYHVFSDGNNNYVITDAEKNIVEITKAPFVWNFARKTGNFYFIDNWLKRTNLHKYQAALRGNKLGEPKQLYIVDDEFRSLIGQSDKFKILNFSLLEKPIAKFEVIRAMNIIHYGYFNNAQIHTILNNIHASLANGGLFVEGSNENAGSVTDGGIFKKTNTGFEQLQQADRPSRILKSLLGFKSDL